MQAGRELNALVAERVMGWTEITPGHAHDLRWYGREPGEFFCEIPRYSTELEVALPLWRPWWVAQRYGDEWHVYAGLRDERPLAVGATLEHALCLAALRAVGWTEEGCDAAKP